MDKNNKALNIVRGLNNLKKCDSLLN